MASTNGQACVSNCLAVLGEAWVKAIDEHTDELKMESENSRRAPRRDVKAAWSIGTTCPIPSPVRVRFWSVSDRAESAALTYISPSTGPRC